SDAPLLYSCAQDDDVAAVGAILVGRKAPAGNERSAEQPKEIGAHLACGDLLSVASTREVDGVEAVCGDVLKRTGLLAPDVELGRRRTRSGSPGRGIEKGH